MKFFQIKSKQVLPITKEEAWNFLSTPKNLATITPKHMNFNILSGADKKVFAGQVIHYNVSPFKGYTTRWITEITHVENESYFVDEQRFGPYTFWHHKHFIHPTNKGVILEDVIDYKLPLGILGSLANTIFVKKQLRSIFEFRAKKLQEIFGVTNAPFELELKSI